MRGDWAVVAGRGRARRNALSWGVGLLLIVVTCGGLAALTLPAGALSWRSLGLNALPPQAAASPKVARPLSLSGWRLVWHDEFAGTSLDTSKWNVESHTSGGHSCCLDDGLQAWTPSALSVHDNALWIASARQSYDGRPYTSGAISTLGAYSFRFGRVDIRARLPRGAGLWSAFWLLPAQGTTPGYSPNEIDMMEALGEDTHTVYETTHWGTGFYRRQCVTPTGDDSTSFHTYSLVWTATSLTWYIDGQTVCDSQSGVPQQAMYLILNTYVGGTWPQPVGANTVFPQFTVVDYVRVYQ